MLSGEIMIDIKDSKAKELIVKIRHVDDVDFDLEKCSQKNIILDLLKKHKPKKIKNIDTRGSYWYFGDINNFCYVIDGCEIFLSDIFGPLMGFCEFLEQVAYYDDKKVVYSFDDEGSILVLTSIPVDKDNIRFTIFPYDFRREQKIAKDIVINKNSFIKQMRDLIYRCKYIAKFDKEVKYHSYLIREAESYIEMLDSYLKNPKNFKETHIILKKIRVFDVGYKKQNEDWKFKIYFEDDKESNIKYWEKLKQEGIIEKYDFFEQCPKDNYYFKGKDNKKILYKTKKELKVKPDMESRENKNWVYSKFIKKWYSNDEIMPIPEIKPIVLENFNLDISINRKHRNNEWETIDEYLDELSNTYNKSKSTGVDCILTIQNNGSNYTNEFEYGILTDRFLKRLEGNTSFRFINRSDRSVKIHIWNTNDGYFTVYTDNESEKEKNLLYKIKKDEFIEKTKTALSKIKRQVNFFKSKKDLIVNKIGCFNFDNKSDFYILDELKEKKANEIKKIFDKILKQNKTKSERIDRFLKPLSSPVFYSEYCKINFSNIEIILKFLDNIASKNKANACIIKGQNSIFNIFSYPVNDNDIRLIIFDEADFYQKYYNSNIKYSLEDIKDVTDIIIDKKSLIKEFKDRLDLIAKESNNYLSDKFKVHSKFFNEYLNSSKNYLTPNNEIRYFMYDIIYKNLGGKWLTTVAFDTKNEGLNIKKIWKRKIENKEILDFKLKQKERHSFYYTKERRENEKPNEYLWLYDNWVYSPDTKSWYPKTAVMPEPKRESKNLETYKKAGFEFDYLKIIEDFKYLVKKIKSNKDFHLNIIDCYNYGKIYSFNVWHKKNNKIRMYVAITKGDYDSTELVKTFDITLDKSKFISEFEQMLRQTDVIKGEQDDI